MHLLHTLTLCLFSIVFAFGAMADDVLTPQNLDANPLITPNTTPAVAKPISAPPTGPATPPQNPATPPTPAPSPSMGSPAAPPIPSPPMGSPAAPAPPAATGTTPSKGPVPQATITTSDSKAATPNPSTLPAKPAATKPVTAPASTEAAALPAPAAPATTPAAPLAATTPSSTTPAHPVTGTAPVTAPPAQAPAPDLTPPAPAPEAPSLSPAPAAPPPSPAPAATPSNNASGVLHIVADRWCPYNCEPGNEHPGYMVELLTEIFKKSNITVDYKILPWSLGLAEVGRGEKDALIGLHQSEAKDFTFPSNPIGHYALKLFAKSDSKFHYTGPDSLAGLVFGTVQNYSYGKAIDDYIANDNASKRLFTVSGEQPIATLVTNLLSNKVDVFVEDASVTHYYLKLHKLENQVKEVGDVSLTDASGTAMSPSLYIGFAPNNLKSKDYATLFDQGIEDLRHSGRLNAILMSYGLKDWQYPLALPSRPREGLKEQK